MKKTRILIADDHEIVRRGLRPLIESEWAGKLRGSERRPRSDHLAQQLKPDVVILDVSMPGKPAWKWRAKSSASCPAPNCSLHGTESESLVHQLSAAGARGCGLSSEAAEHLIPPIKALCEHGPHGFARRPASCLKATCKAELRRNNSLPAASPRANSRR